jgi:hypothetical protein|tara:strand:+ start:618 stop:1019 length:402 start_codon:yes stop_codon:yes gene_type:complete
MIEKYLYFRTTDTIGNDDDAAQSLMIPLSRFRGMLPSNSGANGTAADELTLFFESVNNEHSHADNDFIIHDTVLLNITVGKSLQVIKAIGEAITGHKHSDGVIVIADDLSTAPTYVDLGITSCGDITVATQLS